MSTEKRIRIAVKQSDINIKNVTIPMQYIKLCLHNQHWTGISIRSTPFNWTVDDPIFALLHLALIFSTYFWQLIVLMLCKISLSVKNNFANDEHVFLRILNLRVPCLWHLGHTRYMYTVLSIFLLNLVSEICLVNILTFSAWDITVIFELKYFIESFNLCM